MDWHALSAKEAIEKLNSNEKGLTKEQAIQRIDEYGENKLIKIKHFNALKLFFNQFKSFLILILIIAAILSFFMESSIDALIIFIIIFLNAGFGFFQEYKAEKSIEELKKMMVPIAKVLRDGKIIKINSEKLVPGDILILSEGDKIMADARILESEGVKVNEASLTGESTPVEKILKKISISVPLTERLNMLYQGTEIVCGGAKAIVVDTGMKTELGKISELVQEIESEKNPFREQLDSFAKNIGIFVIILGILVVFILILGSTDIVKSLLVAISLAISAIPEGLPAVISLCLAFATRKMISKNVLIRHLSSSETLGRTTVICTDKTGTITEGKMVVSKIYTNGQINPSKNNELLFKTGVLCNKAYHEKNKDGGYFIGDPTEIALIVSAKNNFIDKKELIEEQPKIKEFPFNSNRKMMSIVRESERKYISYVKGAPEIIIQKCDYELINEKKILLEDKDRERLLKIYEEMAREGLRVLGFAYKEIQRYNVAGKTSITEEDTETKLIFVGFQGMIDPPRAEVKNAIELCSQAGIKVLMLTGDSKLTADAVAKNIGLKGKSIDARELEKMDDRELSDKIKDICIFSRISPEDKLRIINILKKKNEIVAMTGDGVNDALALKRADIGIAMSIRGTDVARDASDIILLDDNFASIVEGVKEGRKIYENIKKFVKYLLSANFSEVFLVLLVTLIWRDPKLLPLLPLQILWLNLVSDSLPALALSLEENEEGVMKRKPTKEGILKGMKWFIIIAGFIAFLINFYFFYININSIDRARTMIITSSVMFEMFLAFNCRTKKSAFKSSFNKYLFYAVFVSVGLHLIVLYTPISNLFYFVKLGFYDWFLIILVSFIGFLIIEAYKWYVRKLENNHQNVFKQ